MLLVVVVVVVGVESNGKAPDPAPAAAAAAAATTGPCSRLSRSEDEARTEAGGFCMDSIDITGSLLQEW